jgi:transcriptional regulator with PAS, ATPase and Fis domain
MDFEVPETVEISKEFKAKRVLKMAPSEAQITAVLRQIGKNDPEDELNCGMCGYSTCREKAIAVLEGKAEAEMCLPYMRQKAESFANTVVDILPDALISVDASMKVQQINKAACQLFRVEPDTVVGQSVSHLMDEYDFVTFLSSGESMSQKRAYLPDYSLFLDETFQLDRESGTVVVTMKDLTEETRQKRKNNQTKLQAAALADEIVNKQLRTVHEIAFLLGETAAETKAAVKDLKDAIMLEEEDTP